MKIMTKNMFAIRKDLENTTEGELYSELDDDQWLRSASDGTYDDLNSYVCVSHRRLVTEFTEGEIKTNIILNFTI